MPRRLHPMQRHSLFPTEGLVAAAHTHTHHAQPSVSLLHSLLLPLLCPSFATPVFLALPTPRHHFTNLANAIVFSRRKTQHWSKG